MILTKVMDNNPPKNTGLIDETIIMRVSVNDILDFLKQVVFNLLRFHWFCYISLFNKKNGNTLLLIVSTGELNEVTQKEKTSKCLRKHH